MTVDYGVVRVRPATLADADALAPRLRAADLQEVRALSDADPAESLRRGVKNGVCYTVEGQDKGVIAMFGVVPTPEPKLGAVWLLASDDLLSIRLTFLRHSRRWLAALFKDYELLGNFVDERNTVHVQWLKWLGFRFLRRLPLGRNGESFIEFVRLKSPQDSSLSV